MTGTYSLTGEGVEHLPPAHASGPRSIPSTTGVSPGGFRSDPEVMAMSVSPAAASDPGSATIKTNPLRLTL